MTLVNGIVIMSICLCVWTTPIRIGLVFCGIVVWGTVCAGQVSRVLGLVRFIIYGGGALVLFRYCFMLTPRLERETPPSGVLVGAVVLRGTGVVRASGLIHEFYWSASLILCVGALLFLVIMSVVAIVDLTRGSLRPGGD